MTIGADVIASHRLNELLQLFLIARLLALAYGGGHGAERIAGRGS